MEAEPLFTDTVFLDMLHINAGDLLQAQRFLAHPGPEGDAIGASGRLQGCHGGTRIGFGQVDHPLLYVAISWC